MFKIPGKVKQTINIGCNIVLATSNNVIIIKTSKLMRGSPYGLHLAPVGLILRNWRACLVSTTRKTLSKGEDNKFSGWMECRDGDGAEGKERDIALPSEG